MAQAKNNLVIKKSIASKNKTSGHTKSKVLVTKQENKKTSSIKPKVNSNINSKSLITKSKTKINEFANLDRDTLLKLKTENENYLLVLEARNSELLKMTDKKEIESFDKHHLLLKLKYQKGIFKSAQLPQDCNLEIFYPIKKK